MLRGAGGHPNPNPNPAPAPSPSPRPNPNPNPTPNQADTIEARWLALHARGWVGLLQLQRSPAVAAMRTVCVALGLDPSVCDEAPPYTAAVWQGTASGGRRR